MNELWEKIEAILEIACNVTFFACNPLGEILTCVTTQGKNYGVFLGHSHVVPPHNSTTRIHVRPTAKDMDSIEMCGVEGCWSTMAVPQDH